MCSAAIKLLAFKYNRFLLLFYATVKVKIVIVTCTDVYD